MRLVPVEPVPSPIWQTTRFALDLSRPRVMGIVNLTPDSFSDGGRLATPSLALRHCERLLHEGADVLDLGAESTRPGAEPVPQAEELARLLPVLRELVAWRVPLSVDTFKPDVMAAVLDLGVDIINDVWALRWRDPTAPDAAPRALAVVAGARCGLCLMHMHREPRTMQASPMQGDVVAQVVRFFEQVMGPLQDQGVAANRVVLDPGIGFGKTVAQNFALLSRQRELLAAGQPLLAGWSRKSSLRSVADPVSRTHPDSLDIPAMLVPSTAVALLAVQQGARVVRVHDVRETVQALQVLAAMESAGMNEEGNHG